jgi:hypothetical protein
LADDYLCKPFALIEVGARLEALVRRSHGQTHSELRHGKVTLDPTRLVATLDGEPLTLKPKEFALLELLMRNAGRAPSQNDRGKTVYLGRRRLQQRRSPRSSSAPQAWQRVYPHRARHRLPWVTHEADATPEPEAAPDAPLLALS